MSGPYETLDIRIADHIAVLTLSREARHNAISSRMNGELPQAWRQLEADPAVRVIVVTGAGGKAFCTGADLADLPRTEDPAFARQLASIGWTGRQNGVTKPVIAAINGLAVGAGLHFAADSDIVLAADHAQFVDSHVAVGLIAALEPIGLARRMPLGAVMKLALTGGDERLSAQEAWRLGMVDEIMPLDALMPRAMELAASIARHSPPPSPAPARRSGLRRNCRSAQRWRKGGAISWRRTIIPIWPKAWPHSSKSARPDGAIAIRGTWREVRHADHRPARRGRSDRADQCRRDELLYPGNGRRPRGGPARGGG